MKETHRIFQQNKALRAEFKLIFSNSKKLITMKKFEIKSVGSLSQYVKDNTIKAKGEISNLLFDKDEYRGTSCYGIRIPETSKGLSVSL
jgi:hypothetical protein